MSNNYWLSMGNEKTPQRAQHREQENKRRSEVSKQVRDIGGCPPVFDEERRAACQNNFRLFCETYFAQRFHLDWSDDHLEAIARIEQCVLHGGLFSFAMPRGFGKTSLCEVACIWALVNGHRKFVMLIAADESAAKNILASIKQTLDSNDDLAADYPEVCYPIRRLEGRHHRASGQLSEGKRTHIKWTADEIALPSIEGSRAASGIIRVCGITGRIRGASTTRPSDGLTVRPDLVLLDDPQTDESSRSPSQSQTRLEIVNKAVLGLAGPGKKIACLCACTVINANDLADELLDKKKNPAWQGHRCKLVYEWPTEKKLWDTYAELWATGLADGKGITQATEFYAANRAAMDRGARVAWQQKHNSDEISALQNAVNLKLIDEVGFQSEYQNDPTVVGHATDLPSHDFLTAHVSGQSRGTVPLACNKLVAFIDVQAKCLYYVVAAFADDFTGSVIDYGAWPDQGRQYFTLSEVGRTMQKEKPGAGFEGALYHALESLCNDLTKPYTRESDGTELHVSRILIDSGWGDSTATINQFAREQHRGLVLPSMGRGIGPDNKPMSEWSNKAGDVPGHNWRIQTGRSGARYLLYDANFWKSFTFQRFEVARGDKGSFTFFEAKPTAHKMIVDHLLAEYPVLTAGRGRVVNVWKLKPGRPDNHLGDCIFGCMVAASEQGCLTIGHTKKQEEQKRPRRRVQVAF